jgi:hypothetical protein
VRESISSPYQAPRHQLVDHCRESLAERPGAEGSIQNPFMLTVGTPFSEQITQARLIPSFSNLEAVGAQPGNDLVSRLQDLQVETASQPQPLQRLDTDAELDQEIEDLVEQEGDGPGDTSRLHIYSTVQHFTNIASLDNSVACSPMKGTQAPEPGRFQSQ